MLKYLAFLFFVITAVAPVQRNDINSKENDVDPDPEMEKYLREAIENFRDQMKKGIPAINMPKLDPLKLQNLNINVDENLAAMYLQIQQINIQDLSSFALHYINADLEAFYLNLKLSIPTMRCAGEYNLDGKLLKIFPLSGSGTFSINLTTADISGHGKLVPVEDTLQMNDLELDLSWNKLDIYLENFLGGGRFSEVLQKMIPSVGKKIFESYKPQILSKVNLSLGRSLNETLKEPKVKAIIQGLIP